MDLTNDRVYVKYVLRKFNSINPFIDLVKKTVLKNPTPQEIDDAEEEMDDEDIDPIEEYKRDRAQREGY